MTLVLDWQKKLGYKRDPFDPVPPAPTRKFLIGLDELQERINLFLVKEDRIATISGDKGSGKTMLLLWINEELAPQKTHDQHYIDAMQTGKREQIVTSLLQSRLSLIERMKGAIKLPLEQRETLLIKKMAGEKKNVLIFDNAGQLGQPELELLASIVDQTQTHIIFGDAEDELKELDLPQQLTPKLKLKLPSYRDDQLAELLKRRIEAAGGRGTYPFDDAELSSLFKKAERNPKLLLDLARERAIELSIKPLPKPAAAQPQKQQSFISIQVAKEAKPAASEKTSVAIAQQDHHADAAMLSEIVAQPKPEERATAPAETPKQVEKTIEQVVATLPKTVVRTPKPKETTVADVVEKLPKAAHKKPAKQKPKAKPAHQQAKAEHKKAGHKTAHKR